MSFDESKPKISYNILLQIYSVVDPVYIPIISVSMKAVPVSDGSSWTLYEGTMLSGLRLDEAAPKGFSMDGYPTGKLTIQLANKNGEYNALLEQYNYFANKRVRVFLCESGTELDTSSDLMFEGFVRHPNGVKITGSYLTLEVSDIREAWNDKIPNEPMEDDDYEYIPDENNGKMHPILYGDFTTELYGSGYGAEAFLIDDGERTGSGDVDQTLIIGKPIERLGFIDEGNSKITIYRDNDPNSDFVTTADAYDADEEAGTVKLDLSTWSGNGGSYQYQEGDRFFIKAKGDVAVAGSTTPITNPAEIIRHMLVNYTGLTSDNIDSATYTVVVTKLSKGFIGKYFKARRQLIEKEKIWDVIRELAFEFGIDIAWRGSKVYFYLWEPYLVDSSSDPTPDIDKDNMTNCNSIPGEIGITCHIDPESQYMTNISAKYCYLPARDVLRKDGGYNRIYSREIAAADRITTKKVDREFKFNWSYNRKSVKIMCDRFLFLYSKYVRYYDVCMGFAALKYTLHQRKNVNYTKGPFDLQYKDMQIVKITADYVNGKVTLRLIDSIMRVDIGRWAPADIPRYDDASCTDEMQEKWGFWTDTNGEVEDIDGNKEKPSHWI